jgi:hypothetical protein
MQRQMCTHAETSADPGTAAIVEDHNRLPMLGFREAV